MIDPKYCERCGGEPDACGLFKCPKCGKVICCHCSGYLALNFKHIQCLDCLGKVLMKGGNAIGKAPDTDNGIISGSKCNTIYYAD